MSMQFHNCDVYRVSRMKEMVWGREMKEAARTEGKGGWGLA